MRVESHKTRILFLIGNYGTGGKERQLTEIIKHLSSEKYAIHLFSKCNSSYYFNSIKKFLVSYCSLNKKYFNFNDIFELRKFLKNVHPDVVFTFSSTLGHYALLIKLLGGFSYRLINGSIRNAPVDLNMYMRLDKIMFNLYKEVVANSKAGLRAYNQLHKKGRYVLQNAFDVSRVPTRSKEELRLKLGLNAKFTVVMVASMGETKDQKTFIKAASKVLEINDDIQFILIGDGPKKYQYVRLVSSFGNEKDVSFKGEVANVEEYFKASDLSVLMSTNAEGFPNVVLESLACGTPVIANKEGGTNEILANNFNGFLIDKNDYKTLAKKILYLKKNHSTLQRLSRNGVKTVTKSYTTEKMNTTFNNIIEKGYSEILL